MILLVIMMAIGLFECRIFFRNKPLALWSSKRKLYFAYWSIATGLFVVASVFQMMHNYSIVLIALGAAMGGMVLVPCGEPMINNNRVLRYGRNCGCLIVGGFSIGLGIFLPIISR